MALRINSEAPNFTADTTQGKITFHDWIGNGWAILFSHPKDFTPVCTTELGYMAGLKPEFDKRGCKILGLSVDPVGDHERWAKDIQDTSGHAVTYPMIGDADLPDVDGPQFRRGAATPRCVPAHQQAQGRDAGELEAGAGRHHRHRGLGRRGEEDVPGRLQDDQAVPADRRPAEVASVQPK